MNRRQFMTAAGALALGDAAAVGKAAGGLDVSREPAGRNGGRVLMHLGTQIGQVTPQILQYLKRHGVDYLCANPPDPGERGYWTADEVARTRELCEQHGLTLSMVALPFLSSSHIDREKRGAIMLGQSPERDRDIEHIHRMTEACARAGVPAWKYNLSLLGVLRTASTPGRGGSAYSTWRLAEARPDPALTRAGAVDADLFWERITYFLERVIPVCAEYKVRAACHPHDPGVPASGYQGIDRVLGTFEGLKKFVSIQENPYHGLNLCLGTMSENLRDPAREICDVIRYFGERDKIFNVHFRNIRGRRDDFQEVYPDEGDLNMFRVALTLHQAGYRYMIMPDHMPRHPDDPDGNQAFAFGFGYIKAMVQGVENSADYFTPSALSRNS